MSVDVSEIRKEGWVNKESAVIRTYRKRWMVLTPDRLYSFKGEPAPDSLLPRPPAPGRCGASRGRRARATERARARRALSEPRRAESTPWARTA